MHSFFIPLIPAALLLLAISIAGVLSFLIVSVIGDALPLGKVLSKSTLILLVLSIYPIMVWLHLKKQDIGLTNDKKSFFKQVAKGLFLGILILTPIIISLYCLDLWYYDIHKNWTAPKIIAKVLGLLLIALLISVPEELIFRGILLTGLRKKIGVVLSISLSAFYYAGLHFLRSKTEIPLSELSIMSGYLIAAESFNNLLKLSNLSAFIALFTVGTFLACVRIRLPSSLGLCIGIHAGWVFTIKLTSAFLDKNYASDLRFLVSTYDGIIGPLVSIWLILLTAFFLWRFKHNKLGSLQEKSNTHSDLKT